MDDRENAFLADFIGDTGPNVSRGGYVFKFLVPFPDVEKARRICGGAPRPDDPITVGITQVGRIAKNENGEYEQK